MSVVHGQTAVECGVKPENIIIPKIGEVLHLIDKKLFKTNEIISTGPIFIDGDIVSRVNSQIIKERDALGENGFVQVVVGIDKKNNNIVGKPRIISRGSFFVKTSNDLVEEVKRIVHGAILFTIKNKTNWEIPELKQLIKDRLEPFFYKEKRRRPIIMSTILFVDDKTDPLEEFKLQFQEEIKNKNIPILEEDEEENEE